MVVWITAHACNLRPAAVPLAGAHVLEKRTRERAMNRTLRKCAVTLIAGMAVPIIAAKAQQGTFGGRWPQDAPAATPQAPPVVPQENRPAGEPSTNVEPSTNAPRAAKPTASTPGVVGTWSGSVTQVSGESKYTVVLTLTRNAGQTDYPELNCGGKLTRIGASKDYVFYVEVITRGQAEKGGRCPDGTITVARAGDKLNWVWFGIPQDSVIVAFGTLTRKTTR